MLYIATNDSHRAIAIAEKPQSPMRKANVYQKEHPNEFVAVYRYDNADHIKIGDYVGGLHGVHYASSNNYPQASTKLIREL